ncbi:MAG: hypothetical protein K0S93_1392, partial [Nitrososphaeraceae archaeon]|nr:hypothetical protein [Nitrososphaeraceae archaeon]
MMRKFLLTTSFFTLILILLLVNAVNVMSFNPENSNNTEFTNNNTN